jgi:phospholipase C
MASTDRTAALDHVVVVLFENRSLDNMLGHLYGPDDGKTFEGVIGKDLSNPIPDWAEQGAEEKVVPYEVATEMDSPNPDSGEEWYHTNTQLFNVLDENNRFKIGKAVTEPWNAPAAGATPTMDGFVTDYISHVHRRGRPSAGLRGVRPDHDRVHAGAAARAQRDRT